MILGVVIAIVALAGGLSFFRWYTSAAQKTKRALRDAKEKAIRAAAAVPIIVGGAPFVQNDAFWRRIGADGSARDAAEAVRLGNRLVEVRR